MASVKRFEDILDTISYQTFCRIVADQRHYRVVVSFGGGGVPGLCGNLALASLLETLDVKRYIEQIWGTSAGAIIGGGWASGTPAAEMLRLIKSLDRPGAKDYCIREFLVALPRLPFDGQLPEALMHGRQFAATIKSGLSVSTFEECAIPFRCIACCDDYPHNHKIFCQGPLLPAILASASLPGILPPFPADDAQGHHYFDGAMAEKTPLLSPLAEHLRSGDPRKLLIIGTRFNYEHHGQSPRGFINRFLQGIYVMQDQLWEYQLKSVRSRTDVALILLNPHILDESLFDFTRVEENYNHAYRMYLGALQNSKLALTFGVR